MDRNDDQLDAPPPVACTLDPSQRRARKVEWSDVGSLARSTEALPDGVVSMFDLSVADGIEDLAGRESACCGSWLRVVATRLPDAVRLELTTANPDGLALIRSMAGLSA